MLPGLSGVAYLLASAGSGGVTNPININNETATKTKTDGTAATASFTFNTDRTVKDQDGVNLDAAWCTAGTVVGDYSIRVTVNSGNTPTGTVGSWLNLGTARTWSLTDAAGAAGTKTCSLTVEIREDASGLVKDTATYTITADSQSGGGTTFNPVPGSYYNSGDGSAELSVTASASVTWTWSVSSGFTPTSTIPSGGSGTTITFTLVNGGATDRSSVITLQSGSNNWTLSLDAYGSGGVTMTL